MHILIKTFEWVFLLEDNNEILVGAKDTGEVNCIWESWDYDMKFDDIDYERCKDVGNKSKK